MNVKATTDIWFSSFLRMKGYEIANFDVLPRMKGRYYFKISEDDWKKMKVEFNKSTVSEIKMQQIALKDMLY